MSEPGKREDKAEEMNGDPGQEPGTDESVEDQEGTVDELSEALREKDQFKRLAQRTQADFINFRKRVQSEQEESQARAVRRFALRIIEVVDQLDAALAPAAAEGADNSWVEGVRAIQRNFASALASEGFERFECVGQRFDPHSHEALISTPTAEYAPDTVIQELRPGYKHRGEIVRPAQVAIAVAPPDDQPEAGE